MAVMVKCQHTFGHIVSIEEVIVTVYIRALFPVFLIFKLIVISKQYKHHNKQQLSQAQCHRSCIYS